MLYWTLAANAPDDALRRNPSSATNTVARCRIARPVPCALAAGQSRRPADGSRIAALWLRLQSAPRREPFPPREASPRELPARRHACGLDRRRMSETDEQLRAPAVGQIEDRADRRL